MLNIIEIYYTSHIITTYYIYNVPILIYIKVHTGDSGEQGWGDLIIPIPIFDRRDESSPYSSPNR
jgi:hypothetical protein